jgi:hypothetical protein
MKIEINIEDYPTKEDWVEVLNILEEYMNDYLNYKVVPELETFYDCKNVNTNCTFTIKVSALV